MEDGKKAAIGLVVAGLVTTGVILATRAKAAPPFDPWIYDFNGDWVIDINETLAAVSDYYAGIITRGQLDQVLALRG